MENVSQCFQLCLNLKHKFEKDVHLFKWNNGYIYLYLA